VWLLPPNKKAERTTTTAIAYTGEPVKLVKFIDSEDATRTSIPIALMRSWLKNRGFVEKLSDGSSGFLVAVLDDIGVAPSTDESRPDDVNSIIVAFDLCRAAPLRLPAWNQMVSEMCNAWPLRLYDRHSDSVCDISDFEALIKREPDWLMFFPSDEGAKSD
jgi:hypothetical protein